MRAQVLKISTKVSHLSEAVQAIRQRVLPSFFLGRKVLSVLPKPLIFRLATADQTTGQVAVERRVTFDIEKDFIECVVLVCQHNDRANGLAVRYERLPHDV
jgi:hypothetical protein